MGGIAPGWESTNGFDQALVKYAGNAEHVMTLGLVVPKEALERRAARICVQCAGDALNTALSAVPE